MRLAGLAIGLALAAAALPSGRVAAQDSVVRVPPYDFGCRPKSLPCQHDEEARLGVLRKVQGPSVNASSFTGINFEVETEGPVTVTALIASWALDRGTTFAFGPQLPIDRFDICIDLNLTAFIPASCGDFKGEEIVELATLSFTRTLAPGLHTVYVFYDWGIVACIPDAPCPPPRENRTIVSAIRVTSGPASP